MTMIIDITEEKDLYKTSDLALAGVISIYIPLEAIEKIPHKSKVFFVFKRDSNGELDELVRRYYRRELTIEPILYFEQLSLLKSRIYAEE